MFIKPYRIPTHSNSVQNRNNWFRQDIADSSEQFFESLNNHFTQNNNTLGPVINKGTGVSFQYAGSNDYIVRDLGFSTFIVKSLLDNQITEGFDKKIDTVFKRIAELDQFLNKHKEKELVFSSLNIKSSYSKSIVIGINPEADTIHDIEYVDIFFDSQSNLVPYELKKPFIKNPEYKTRSGFAVRLNFKTADSDYKMIVETITGALCGDTGWSNCTVCNVLDNDNVFNQYIVDSTEFYYEASIIDLNGLSMKYLEAHLDLLSQRLGYSVQFVDQKILDIVDMQLI